MTEELKQKAEKCAEKFFGKPTDLVDLDNLRIFKNGYIAGATENGIQWHDLKEDSSDVPKGYVHRKILLQDRYGYIYTGNYYPKDDCHPKDCFAVEWLDKGFQGSNFVAFEQIAKWAEFKE